MYRLPISITLIAIGLAVGCTKARESTPNAVGDAGIFQSAGLHNVTTRPYRIDPPDEIRVRAPKVPELDGQIGIVRPDGTASFPLLGPLQFAGKSAEEARQTISTALGGYYKAADLQVDVAAKSKFIYIFGFGADRRGKLEYTGRTTVINAIADAGFNTQGWPQQVWISRPARDGHDKATVVVNFKLMSQYGDLTQNYLLEEGDIVYIPYSPLAALSEKLTRVLSPITGTLNGIQAPANVARSFDDIKN